MTIHPFGRKMLCSAIEGAVASPKGPCYADEMVTLVSNDDGSMTFRKFVLADMGDYDAQIEFLHDVLLDECPVKPFRDWEHLEVRGKGRYRQGTGYGRRFLIGVLEKYGCLTPDETFDVLFTSGRVKSLGEFNASVGGGPFEMFAAVPTNEGE
jgi:hypothetical protein